jgi:DNA-binding transcriptional LysR family regulator
MGALIKVKASRGAAHPAPDLNDVALFVLVVQAASFSSAARARGVPVSTVSRRIARLESALDARLLERTTRRLHLTDAGRQYFAHAERAIDELGQGSNHLRALDVVPRGRVRITAPVGVGRMLTSALASYIDAAPAVSVELELSDRRADLLAEGFDIAVRSGRIDTADFVGRQIVATARGLFASVEYLDRRGRPRRLADLLAHDLIATRSSATGTVWELFGGGRRRRRHRFAFAPRFVVNDLATARYAVRSGIGISMLPTADLEAGELERVLPRLAGESGGLWLLYPAHRSLTAAVRSCVDHLLARLPTTGDRLA